MTAMEQMFMAILYFVWSLMDNYERAHGYNVRLGLHYFYRGSKITWEGKGSIQWFLLWYNPLDHSIYISNENSCKW
ncbi:putative thioglucosidase [Helianthus anomalus]